MSTTKEFVEYVCERIAKQYDVRYRYMFGEYMVYVNDKPILLICDNTVYIKKIANLDKFKLTQEGSPYPGAKLHYILDMDDDQTNDIIQLIEETTKLKKSKKKNP